MPIGGQGLGWGSLKSRKATLSLRGNILKRHNVLEHTGHSGELPYPAQPSTSGPSSVTASWAPDAWIHTHLPRASLSPCESHRVDTPHPLSLQCPLRPRPRPPLLCTVMENRAQLLTASETQPQPSPPEQPYPAQHQLPLSNRTWTGEFLVQQGTALL